METVSLPRSPDFRAVSVQDGVLLLENLVLAEKQEEVCALLLSGQIHDWRKFQGPEYRNNPFLAFCHLTAQRWNKATAKGSVTSQLVSQLSDEIHRSLYEKGGVFASLPENGCAEDHEGRPCQCADKTPLYPRSTALNCVEGLVYRAGSQRGYHRDAHWMVGLSFGCDVTMGFQRHDHTAKFTVCIKSGNAVIFNGALHSHAVLSITEGTSPSWWKYPFSRAVFLMRDSRQSLAARRRRDARRQAALEGGKKAAAIAAAKLAAQSVQM